MKLIVGLGNPGEKYENTRHNTGFLAVDKLADTLNVRIRRKAFSALIEKINVGGEQVVLMKPQTYMNLSGEAAEADLSSAAEFSELKAVLNTNEEKIELNDSTLKLPGWSIAVLGKKQ